MVEQRRHQQPGAGGDLGDHRVGGGGLDRAGAAGVPELQLGAARRSASAISRRRTASWVIDSALIRRTISRPGALRSAPRPGRRRPGPRRSSRRPAGSRRRSTISRASATTSSVSCSGERLGPTCWPPIRSPASTSIATRTGTAWETRTESTTSRWATLSTISVIAAGGGRRGDQLGERAAVDGRVGDHDVVADALLVAARAPRAACSRARRGSRRGPAPGSSSAGTRSDLEATRIGVPPARRTRSSALASNASRSTTIRRASAAARRAWRPRR